MPEIPLSRWDKLRGVKGYTLQIKMTDGEWVYLHPHRDGSPYLMSKDHAELTFKDLAVVPGSVVRIHPVKGAGR